MNMKLFAAGAALAILAIPMAHSVNAQPRRPAYRHYGYAPGRSYPLRRLPGGDLVDRNGWRYRPGLGWDNTCFNLDYLPSQYACSPATRR